ncbi:acyltransferase [Candidatus Hepatincola sp. Pdp]
MPKSTNYYHIQILRALAVFVVIIFHLNKDLLPNGYLGVDIFFVISGFVITNSIINSYNKGTFTFLSFYTNRVKRLFPALFVVIVITCIFAFSMFTSVEYYYLKATYFWYVPLQISNFAFAFYNKSYWDTGDNSIYLHTWSLGVEEQIYLVFPFILLGAYLIYKKEAKMMNFFLILLSLISIYFFITMKPQIAFYMPYTRAWEFLAGTIIYFIFQTIKRKPKHNNSLLILFSILLILFLYFDFSFDKIILSHSPHLSRLNSHLNKLNFNQFLLCIFAVLLSGLVILYGLYKPIKINYFTNFFIHLGDLSYSLYLWHFPIIIFYKKLYLTITGNNINGIDYVIILIITYVFACLSYYLIENPFRRVKSNTRLKQTTILLIAIGTMATLSYFMHISSRFIHSYYDAKEGVILQNAYNSISNKKARLKKHDFGFKRSVLYVGDSHGVEKNEAMLAWAKRNHVNIYIATSPGCYDITFTNHVVKSSCFKSKKFINKILLTDTALNTIILSYRYLGIPKQAQKNIDYLLSINKKLHLIMIEDHPELIFPATTCIRDFTLLAQNKYLQSLFSKHKCLILDLKKSEAERKPLITFINNYNKQGMNITFVPMLQYYKTPEVKGIILFTDNHLSVNGAKYIQNHTKAFDFKISP